ncbi:MAG: dipeptidyl aminopeptidase/acylaminoacyl peptidase [Chlamydiales bacterium]|jgi:dipeptidyl aminopeptidase/acylaminoacyl peptidase
MSKRLALMGILMSFAAAITAPKADCAETTMTPELLWKLGRIGGSTISAGGHWVAFAVRHYELAEDKGTSTVHIHDVTTGKTRAVLHDWASVGGLQFAPSPIGERLFFTGGSGASDLAPQVWALDPVDGGLLQVTDIEDGVSGLKVSPTGKHLLFALDIKLDMEVPELYEDLPKADARIIDSLMYRHWDAWHDYKYSHLHVAAMDSAAHAEDAVDLMQDMKVDCPVPPFAGSEQYSWSPDGKEVAFTMKEVERWAESTNSDVYVVSIDAPEMHKNLTATQPGYDNDPVYSPDGKTIAYHSMERPGFEADRNRVMLYNRASGETREMTAGLDQMAHGATWLPGSDAMLFTSEWRGTNQLFRMDSAGGEAKQVSQGRFNWGLVDVFPDGKRALMTFMDMTRPRELAIVSLADGSSDTITDVNGEIYAELQLPRIDERWVEATDGEKIHCWVIYPPNFDASKKWPLLTYCQGGPQGQIGQWFSYRWNFTLMASMGYVVVAPNRRGLPGFGREWNDEISGDWGGQAMQDLLAATDSMLGESYIDPERTGAIGASFGGYSVYWLMGNHEDRFKTMIAHCGVFNLESMYGSTEELFFVNWDLGGPYWKSPEVKQSYDRFSPNRFVGNWETPLLVIHGQKDFRVPVTQGMEAFNAAQIQGVPSRFLYYPEEGHWVMKPQNGVLWHRVFFDWLGRACQPEVETGP